MLYTLRVRRTEKRNNDVESHWKGPYTLPWIHWHNCIEAETKMWLRLNGISVINTSSKRTHIFQIQFRANRLCFISIWTHTTQINSKSKSYHHCSWTSGCFFTHFVSYKIWLKLSYISNGKLVKYLYISVSFFTINIWSLNGLKI